MAQSWYPEVVAMALRSVAYTAPEDRGGVLPELVLGKVFIMILPAADLFIVSVYL